MTQPYRLEILYFVTSFNLVTFLKKNLAAKRRRMRKRGKISLLTLFVNFALCGKKVFSLALFSVLEIKKF